MKNRISITGTVKYMNIGTGFWAIFGEDGKEYRPVNMPEQLKMEGASIRCGGYELEDDMSVFMWGIPIRIASFQTTLK